MVTATKLPPSKVFNSELTQCWQALQGSRRVAIYRCLIDITGSLKTAAMLSQLIYWTRVSKEVAERDGWIFKSIAQMEAETGLTVREQRTCKNKLLETNFIQTCRKGVGAALAIKVNLDAIAELIAKSSGTDDQLALTLADLQNTSSLYFRKHFSKRIAYHRDLVSITGCINSAVLLSCVLNDAVGLVSQNPHLQRHAFATLTATDWEERTSLSYKSQLTARNRLKNLNLIYERNFLASRRIFTLVNGHDIVISIKKLLAGKQDDGFSPYNSKKREILSLAERAKCDWRKGPNGLDKGFQSDSEGDAPLFPSMTSGSVEREYSDVSNWNFKKGHSGKFTSVDWESSDLSNRQIIYYINYKGVYNYNYMTVEPNKSRSSEQDHVVVVDDVDLIYPKLFNVQMRQQADLIFTKHLSKSSWALRQEILDEIQGQKKEVTSPLGLLINLCRCASQGNFTALVAPQVRFQREQDQKLQAYLEKQNNQEQDSLDTMDVELARNNLRKFYSKK
ncbi:hypothetical protein HHB65_02835 [Neisseria meningitidis]|uniref:hypothetical protein n=1 Tax=Neisseria meningitidis TaxID=487 RepID=UPI001C575442|nr:hypothetical protein [Neisseria meningitidis]MBW3956282.1 hypothetical protein [Neisseria meningitidis]